MSGKYKIPDVCEYPEGSIGYASWFGEKHGRAAWLAGCTEDECPFTTHEMTLERCGWHIGWALCQAEHEKIKRWKDGE